MFANDRWAISDAMLVFMRRAMALVPLGHRRFLAAASSDHRASPIERFVNTRVDPQSLVPPSQQLVAAALDAIACGELQPGDKLPSVRGLAAVALVNPNTVTKAYRDLERLGATLGRNGSGVFVTERGPDVARGIRLAETLAAFRDAVEQALRAGHQGAVLADQLTVLETEAMDTAGQNRGSER